MLCACLFPCTANAGLDRGSRDRLLLDDVRRKAALLLAARGVPGVLVFNLICGKRHETADGGVVYSMAVRGVLEFRRPGRTSYRVAVSLRVSSKLKGFGPDPLKDLVLRHRCVMITTSVAVCHHKGSREVKLDSAVQHFQHLQLITLFGRQIVA